MKKRNTYLYRLKDGRKIVYYGISKSPDSRVIEHKSSDKKFTSSEVWPHPMSRDTAQKRETEEIQKYKQHHKSKPPKYNKQKTS